MKNEIWLVSELFYPETISTGYIMTEIAKYLSKGYKVNIIAGPEFYEEKGIKKEYDKLDNIYINRINFSGYNKNKFITRVIGHLTVTLRMFSLMRRLIPKGSEVLLVTNPVLLVPLVSFVVKKRQWNVKLFIHDVFPDNLVISGFLKSKDSFFYKLFSKIFNSAYKKMNTIVVCGRDMKEVFIKKTCAVEKIVVIENWADIENINFKETDNLKTNFLFAGNLGRLQGLETLMKVIKEIGNLDCNFTFIGSGASEKYIKDYVEINALTNVKISGWIQREEQDVFLSQASIGLISLKSGMYGLGVPSKLYNLLAAGKPILYIGDNNSEIHLVIKENSIGWFAESNNEEMIKNTILEIIKCDSLKIKEYSNNSRKLAENVYSKRIILNKINELFT